MSSRTTVLKFVNTGHMGQLGHALTRKKRVRLFWQHVGTQGASLPKAHLSILLRFRSLGAEQYAAQSAKPQFFLSHGRDQCPQARLLWESHCGKGGCVVPVVYRQQHEWQRDAKFTFGHHCTTTILLFYWVPRFCARSQAIRITRKDPAFPFSTAPSLCWLVYYWKSDRQGSRKIRPDKPASERRKPRKPFSARRKNRGGTCTLIGAEQIQARRRLKHEQICHRCGTLEMSQLLGGGRAEIFLPPGLEKHKSGGSAGSMSKSSHIRSYKRHELYADKFSGEKWPSPPLLPGFCRSTCGMRLPASRGDNGQRWCRT